MLGTHKRYVATITSTRKAKFVGFVHTDHPFSSDRTSLQLNTFPSVILPGFLYLGSYDNASHSELLKTQGINRVLNI
ncbi:hypothetical protein F3Y22_tig00001732pilonHSYRG00011 [Hibiscus syriacus]|uniref:Uncharacterized protein n=1 Tax=Hibiscus syriacus TaxID=106335 RepID=A0A6A3CW78_HIBSY|nr:hypothetical protein F3Y22_tig00001732pilonHSYRG00011 [Hibiscus syriacus]